MEETNVTFSKVSFITVSEQSDGQRVDNFLLRELGGVPRSLVYKILRKGEVRVDKKRVKPARKLVIGEVVRIPPVRIEEKTEPPVANEQLLTQLKDAIVLEDQHIIILNKPAGLPVHSGSGHRLGLIEIFRQLRPNMPYIELAHRLDKDTSGLILLAKTRQALQELHQLFKQKGIESGIESGIDKRYLTLISGKWQGGERHIQNELVKVAGKREKIKVAGGAEEGKHAESIFKPLEHYSNCTLLEVKLLTGRMHQIRTQLAHLEMPVLGDARYGDFPLNRHFKRSHGLKRLFLHAYYVDFSMLCSAQHYHLDLPLAEDLQRVLDHL